jgi:hypothetical protein
MHCDYLAVEVNGHDADTEAVALLEHEGWGHFTAMQVRDGRTRGLGLHLARLEAATATSTGSLSTGTSFAPASGMHSTAKRMRASECTATGPG